MWRLSIPLAPYTVRSRITGLLWVVRVFAPDDNWHWLARAVANLDATAVAVRPKRHLIRPTDELFAMGQKLMADAEAELSSESTPRMQGHRFRNGLMLAFLACCPLRARNLTELNLTHNLRKIGSEWWLLVEGAATKTGQSISMPLPAHLAAGLERFVSHWRETLRGDHETDRLWLSWRGHALDYQDIHRTVREITKRCFGQAMHPHIFRDCLATHVAINDPKQVHIVRPLLGHGSIATAGQYYIQAGQHAGARKMQARLMRQRREARRRRRK